MMLWKKGIPAWIRKTLWPIVIGNRLEVRNDEISKKPEITLDQPKPLPHPAAAGGGLGQRVTQVRQEHPALAEDLGNGPEGSPRQSVGLQRFRRGTHETGNFWRELNNLGQSLLSCLQAFVFYRPDVGYVKVSPLGEAGSQLFISVFRGSRISGPCCCSF